MTPQDSALKQFAERLETHGINADARHVAAVVSEVTSELVKGRAEFAAWIGQVALEVAKLTPVKKRVPPDFPPTPKKP